MEKKKILKLLRKKYPKLSTNYLESIVDKFFQIIAKELKNSNRVELRNFGIFKTKELSSRMIFNPHTEALAPVSKRKLPAFKCSKTLHKISA